MISLTFSRIGNRIYLDYEQPDTGRITFNVQATHDDLRTAVYHLTSRASDALLTPLEAALTNKQN